MVSVIFWFVALLHPIHLSVSEIEYSEKNKALQITSRIFTDDLTSAIRLSRNEPELDIFEPKNGLTSNQLILDYLTQHLKVKVDGKLQKIQLLDKEKEGPALICYIDIANIEKVKSLEVFNDIITEIHDDQSNLVHVTYKGPIRSVRLLKEKPSEVFQFDEK